MKFKNYKKDYKDEKLEGVRKVIWDGLWHILYWKGKDLTYDRAPKEVAMYVLRNMQKWRNIKNKS